MKRRLSRQRKGSRRRQRMKERAERRKANRRRIALHHIGKRMAARADTIVLERLPVKTMAKSAKGTWGGAGTQCPRQGGSRPRHLRVRLEPAPAHA